MRNVVLARFREKSRHYPGGMAGFTLIELLTVIALTALTLSLAAPAFRDLIVSQRVKSAAFSLTNAAVFARSEAVKRNASVALTANAGGWANGWSITAGANVVSRQEAFPGGVAITGADTQATYQSSGRLNTAVGNIQVSDDAGGHARCISFDLSGLPKSRMGAC